MQPTITNFNPKDWVLIICAITGMIVFIVAGLKLIFTAKTSDVQGGVDPSSGSANFATKNLAVVTLVVSALLLGFMFSSASAQPVGATDKEKWVYLGSGYDRDTWNFENTSGKREVALKDVLRAVVDVNIRADHFGPFTGILPKYFAPEPDITGMVSKGECIQITDYKNVGFNKIWLMMDKVQCP